MGLSLHIPLSAAPSWPVVTAAMAARGVPIAMRLIDGQPAFPDEAPPHAWRELRVASGTGPMLRMITLRRSPAGIELVAWGNADEPSLKLRDALAAVLGGPGLQPVASDSSCGGGAGCNAQKEPACEADPLDHVPPPAHEGAPS